MVHWARRTRSSLDRRHHVRGPQRHMKDRLNRLYAINRVKRLNEVLGSDVSALGVVAHFDETEATECWILLDSKADIDVVDAAGVETCVFRNGYLIEDLIGKDVTTRELGARLNHIFQSIQKPNLLTVIVMIVLENYILK